MASKVLQKPQIIEIIGSTIRIAHPDISGYKKTYLASPFTAAGTTLTVLDTDGYADNDFILLGEAGDNRTEEIDINQANVAGTVNIARGTSITITNTTKFSHELDTPITLIRERGIKIYGSATDGGALTLITSVDAITTPIADAIPIQWSKPYTEYTILSTDTAYAYYAVKFTDGTTDSSVSDYVLAAGLASSTVQAIYEKALAKTNSIIEDGDDAKITRDFLIKAVNTAQDEIINYTDEKGKKKDWSFEIIEDKTSIVSSQGENTYALSSLTTAPKDNDTNSGFINVRFGADELKFLSIDEFDRITGDKVRTNVATQAAIGATSLVVDDSSEFDDSGTLVILSQTITYTANSKTTNTFSGIPASGGGDITATVNVDDPVWQGDVSADPTYYTVFDGNIILDVPVSSDDAYKKIKIRYPKKLTALTEPTDTTSVSFYHIMVWYVMSQIEFVKGNDDRAERFEAKFFKLLNKNAMRDYIPSGDSNSYYTFGDDFVLQ